MENQEEQKNFYDFEAEDVLCNTVKMEEYRGKVVLIVNTSTRCGFTPQYDGLQDLYEKYQNRGLEILDFPCNQFGNQAPESNEEIVAFCDAKFGITFKHFAKIEVNGENQHPLYKFLKEQKGFGGFQPGHPLITFIESVVARTHSGDINGPDIKWNFTKFLIDREGNVIERFEPTEDLSVVEQRIKELL
ncbi:MAG: glutathione peroxidase [Pararoseburia sp.]|nr:glutathione peroxidase [Pararoseburia sp.]